MNDMSDAVDTQQIGEVAVWAIKDFSVLIRKHVTDQARRQGCTVADWLHAYFHKHGLEGAEINPVKMTEVKPASGLAPVDEACRLADSVARLAEASGDKQKPRGAIQAAARLLRQQVAARTAPEVPRKSKAVQKALPAPADAA